MAGRVLSPKRLALIQKRSEALALRRQGHSWEDIAKRVGFKDGGRAAASVRDHIGKLATEDVPAVMQIELQRLDEMQRALSDDIADGNPRSIEVALKVMAARSELLGLNDYERRMAAAAEARVAVDAQLASQMFTLMQTALSEIGLTEEQQDRVPEVLISIIDRLPNDVKALETGF